MDFQNHMHIACTDWSYQDDNSILDRSLQLAEVKLFVKILYLQGPVPPYGGQTKDLWARVHFRREHLEISQ